MSSTLVRHKPPDIRRTITPRALYEERLRRDQADFHRRVVARDENKCTKCGRTRDQLSDLPWDKKMLIADHITPLKMGGTNETGNGQTHCFFCDVIIGFGWRARYKKVESAEEERAGRARYFAEGRL